ncbi:Hydrolase [Collimonas arenae]|uniref:Hydrolase n=1 Tax=Collimonas arenae TaxID=279058 RepID=A0A0A1F9Q6_9BURK|nr:alpha/beta hydrolase [Collimonas arenae]AIY40515.1 Hydrolase [Collimonas arenae]
MNAPVKFYAKLFVLFLVLATAATSSSAKDPDGREIVADLGKIVNPQGVQENYKVRIGGVDQWIYARGQDRDNPIILFIHGGPASPSAPTMWMYQRPIEEYFTVVNYDQRGAGKTYLETDPDTVRDSLRIDQYVNDAIDIAKYVSNRYGKKKVILIGHSWGTVIGMKAALARPDLFYAYVGIGQVINSRENERLSFDYGLAQAKKAGNQAAVKELEAIAPYPGTQPLTRERIITARKWAQYYGGLAAFRSDFGYYFNAPLLSPEYDQQAAAAIDKGSMLTLGRVLPEFLEVDMKPVVKFPIPVIMFMGRQDYTTPSEPTDEWLKKLDAPYKKGIWFEHAAHLVQFEEPGKTLVSLLTYVRPLATGNVADLPK